MCLPYKITCFVINIPRNADSSVFPIMIKKIEKHLCILLSFKIYLIRSFFIKYDFFEVSNCEISQSRFKNIEFFQCSAPADHRAKPIVAFQRGGFHFRYREAEIFSLAHRGAYSYRASCGCITANHGVSDVPFVSACFASDAKHGREFIPKFWSFRKIHHLESGCLYIFSALGAFHNHGTAEGRS